MRMRVLSGSFCFSRRFAIVIVIAMVVATIAVGCASARSGARGSSRTSSSATAATIDPEETRVVVILSADAPEIGRVPRRTRIVRASATPRPAAEEAAGALERARTAYRDLAFDDALVAVAEAQLVLDARAHTEADFDALTQALLFRGMSELALGHEDRARDALRTVVILRPALVLDEARFSPEVRALHAELVASVRTGAPSAITITAEPADALVSVDGHALGRAPRTVQGRAGRHYVEVAAVGHETRVLSVVLVEGGSPALHVALPIADASTIAASLVTMDARAMELRSGERSALSSALAADRLVLATRPCETACARVIDLATGETSERTARSFRALIAGVAPRSTDRDDDARGDRDDEADDGPSFLATPWPWVVLGVAAVGAGITAGVVLSQDPGTRVVLTPR